MANIKMKNSRSSNNLGASSNSSRRASAASRYKRVGSRGVSSQAAPQTYEILKATEELSKKGLSTVPGTGENSPNDMAMSLLEAMGCSLATDKGKDYSLKTDTTNTTQIKNPNILDETRIKKKKKMKGAQERFSNSSDPFYQLDGDPPEQLTQDDRRRKKKMTPNVVSVAADLAKLNMGAAASTLTQFKKHA